MKKTLNRRRMLRGLVAGSGLCLALPPLEAMLRSDGTAYADDSPLPSFYLTWAQGNGTPLDGVVPTSQGVGFDLPEFIAPLAPYSNDMTLLTGMVNQHGGGHVAAIASQLTATHAGGPMAEAVTGESIDNYLASRWAGQTPIRSIYAGNSERGWSGNRYSNGMASFGPGGTRNPTTYQPRELFQQLFAVGGTNPETAFDEARRSVRRAALDAIREDAAGLRRQVGRADQQRLDQHLQQIADAEDAVDSFESLACQFPLEPTEFGYVANREPLEEKNEIIAHLLALAFQCGITRVGTYAFTMPQSDTVIWQRGATEGWHILTHDSVESERINPEADLDESARQVERNFEFSMTMLAQLLERFRSTPSGAGNLLDRGCILATFELGSFLHHGARDHSLMFFGRANGALRPAGHIVKDDDNPAKALITAMAALGERPEIFGTGDAATGEAFDELLV